MGENAVGTGGGRRAEGLAQPEADPAQVDRHGQVAVIGDDVVDRIEALAPEAELIVFDQRLLLAHRMADERQFEEAAGGRLPVRRLDRGRHDRVDAKGTSHSVSPVR